jgi:two-component system LytT family response regulator
VTQNINEVKQAKAENSKLSITTISGTQLIDKSSISHFNADGSYTEIVLTNGKSITASKSLKFFENQIEHHSKFLKIHKSTIINVAHVIALDRIENNIIMSNDVKLSIARSNIKNVFNYFNK